jgi:ketosteroid isomerase-like protein
LALVAVFAVSTGLLVVSNAAADEEADHTALQELVKKYEEVVQKGDPSLLKPYLAPGFTGVMVTGEEVSSFESLDAYWKKIQGLLGKGGKYTVKIKVPERATIAGDLAYAHGTSEDTAVTAAGREYRFQGFWTAVCARQADGWKIARIHGSMDAISNTFVMSAIRMASTTSALIGGVVGFAIGAILLWILARRRGRSSVTA